MPFKRRQYRRRPRRMMRRKPGMRYRRGPSRASLHAPKQFCEVFKLYDLVSPGQGGAASTGYNFAIQGNSLINLRTALTDVFKQFAITAVKLMYIPAYNNYPLVPGTAIAPHIYFAEDKSTSVVDTPTGPTGVAAMLQQDNVRILDSSKRWSAFIKNPRPFLESYNSNAAGAGSHTPVQPPSRGIQWLTTQTDDLAYSGLVVDHLNSICVVEQNNSAVNITTGTVWAKVYYACKEQQ